MRKSVSETVPGEILHELAMPRLFIPRLNFSRMHRAISFGHKDAAELLISKGAGVNAKDNDGKTSLHKAMSLERTDGAELLVTRGANVNAKDNKGETPLQTATTENMKALLHKHDKK